MNKNFNEMPKLGNQQGLPEKSLDLNKLNKFFNITHIDQDMSFPLDEREDLKNKPVWITFSENGESIEGKFFESEQENSEIIIFEPGMPGSSVRLAEENHVKNIVESGYSVLVLRHRGLKISSDKLVNCPERLKKDNSSDILGKGNGKNTLEKIYNELSIVLNSLSPQVKKIDLIGHSTGSSCIAYSLPKIKDDVLKKINKFISGAGWLGEYNESTGSFDKAGRFDADKLEKYYEYCKQFVELDDAKNEVESQKKLFDYIRKNPLPQSIDFISLISNKDEYIDEKEPNEFRKIQGRGLNIVTEGERISNDFEYHDLSNVETKNIIRCLKMKIGKHPHDIIVDKESKSKEASILGK